MSSAKVEKSGVYLNKANRKQSSVCLSVNFERCLVLVCFKYETADSHKYVDPKQEWKRSLHFLKYFHGEAAGLASFSWRFEDERRIFLNPIIVYFLYWINKKAFCIWLI